jgi:hypothetical protein
LKQPSANKKLKRAAVDAAKRFRGSGYKRDGKKKKKKQKNDNNHNNSNNNDNDNDSDNNNKTKSKVEDSKRA